MKKSQQIANEIAQKRQAVAALFKQHGDNMPAEVAADVEAKMAEIETQNQEHSRQLFLEKAEADNEAELKRLNETAANPLPHSGSQPGQVKVESFDPAGSTIVDKKDFSVVYEEGFLGLDQKTLSAISSLDYKRTFRNYLRKGINQLGPGELKTLQEGVDSQGGFLVPDDVLNRIIQRKPTPTRIASRVMRLQTSRDRLLIPKVNYTADNIYTTGIRVTFTGEKPATSTAHRVTDPVFGQVEIPVYTAMLSMPITNDMIEDSAFPIVGWASDKFRETVDLLYDDKIVNGSGIKQPAGILMNPGGDGEPEVVKSGDANLLMPDGLIDLSYTLPEQYDENACFFLNKTSSGRAIAKMKDADNRYLFGQGAQDSGIATARPKELLGYDYAFSAFMPNVAANAFPIIFGDPTGYYHVERIGFSIQVLREVGAEDNEIRLVGRLRFGGKVAEEFKLKIQKVAA